MSVVDTQARRTGAAIDSEARRIDARVVGTAVAALAAVALAAFDASGPRMAVLALIGGGLGIALYHAAFGFTGAWRAFLSEGRGTGLRAQMVMLAVATAVFLPMLAAGSVFGQPVGGAVAPVGVSVIVGAFLFGVGMQLGGACASGTLFTVGAGSTKMLITLAFFLVGSLLGSLHFPWWAATPDLGRISLLEQFGLWGALPLQLAAFGAIALATVWVERRRHGRVLSARPSGPAGWRRLVQGPWPMVWGGVALALLNAATLAVAGFPWSVSFGYTLWGAKIASAIGFDVTASTYWSWSWAKAALENSVFADTISVMNFGIILGALLAAGLAGRFAPSRRIPWRAAVAAVIGGLLMGYGARLAYGCNIGAFFSGVASGSLHGWLWLLAALAGNWLGVRLRPLFRL